MISMSSTLVRQALNKSAPDWSIERQPSHNAMKYHFASDNTAGVAPEAWAALEEANRDYTPGYGEDEWTNAACQLLREVFARDCEVFFTFNGTAANSLALSSMCQSYHSIICHEAAHVETDECGAPEFYSNGTKILLAGGANGKLDIKEIEHQITRRTDIHFPKPKVISITQATELGTLYTRDEIAEIGAIARHHRLKLHMDGARFANAVAALDLSPAALTWQSGVDVLCFGGTKLGMAVGDAVVFFDKALATEFDYRCKQSGQLASKMRFLTAPWVGLYRDDSWLRYARHANQCAKKLAAGLEEIPGVVLNAPVEANGVFVSLPENISRHLKEKGWYFYNFFAGGARLMCSWNTSEDDIQAFVNDAKQGRADN